jgi:multiple sugar transport system substrate-binding protein
VSSDTLRGLCWDHPRSYLPLEATSRIADVAWERRSLDRFNDEPLENVLTRYDLVVIDHPFVGRAAENALLTPLGELVAPELLAAAGRDAVGHGHEAYRSGGALWALDIDSACQVAVRARDRLTEGETPRSWPEVLALARRRPGRVGMPLGAADAWCALLSLSSLAGAPFTEDSLGGVDEAFESLRELASLVHPRSSTWNPPAVLDRMVKEGDVDYVPLLFGYAIASRVHPGLAFEDAPFEGGRGGPLLGGSGIAVSSSSSRKRLAGRYLESLIAPAIQRDVLAAAGGQPPSMSVWMDPDLDAQSGNFFSRTVKSLTSAYLRPREAWWPAFQHRAAGIVHTALAEGTAGTVLRDRLTALRESEAPA